ncbi:MAG: EutN/CcmL family microcompartment protein [Acidobacteria bacterium]|nr:EutN/CcmL family microcompartment protein [Acidobacteriota bacterium]
MIIGRVCGTVVATRKDPRLEGKKLLIVERLNPTDGTPRGYIIAVDTVGAGAGERVLCVSGSSARLSHGMKDHPVDTAIIAIIDSICLDR